MRREELEHRIRAAGSILCRRRRWCRMRPTWSRSTIPADARRTWWTARWASSPRFGGGVAGVRPGRVTVDQPPPGRLAAAAGGAAPGGCAGRRRSCGHAPGAARRHRLHGGGRDRVLAAIVADFR